MQVSFWSSVSNALGIGRTGPGARDQQIKQHVANLKNDNPDMRRSAAWSLGKIKPPAREAIGPLTESANKDPVEAVRHSAQWALKSISGQKS